MKHERLVLWRDPAYANAGDVMLVKCQEFDFPVMAALTPIGTWFALRFDVRVNPTSCYYGRMRKLEGLLAPDPARLASLLD